MTHQTALLLIALALAAAPLAAQEDTTCDPTTQTCPAPEDDGGQVTLDP